MKTTTSVRIVLQCWFGIWASLLDSLVGFIANFWNFDNPELVLVHVFM